MKTKLPHDQSSFFKSPKYWKAVHIFIQNELNNDGIDQTSGFFIPKKQTQKAYIIAKESGILSGKEELDFFLLTFFPKIKYKWNIEKTDNYYYLKKNQKIFFCSGNTREIMKFERVFLNILSRMSGIASHVKKISQNLKTPIATTRKTQWSFLDKKAVFEGGGLTHRIGLFDGIMLKENHLISIDYDFILHEDILNSFITRNIQFIEVEVETETEFKKIFKTFFPDFSEKSTKSSYSNKLLDIKKIIMFDNFSPKSIKKIIKTLPSLTERHSKNLFLEASGGISQANIEKYQDTGVDVISMGSITNNVTPIDFSLRLEQQ